MDPSLYPGLGRGRIALTGSTTLDQSHVGLIIDTTSGSPTLGLTAAATLGTQWQTLIYNSGSGSPVIDPAGAEVIRTPSGTVSTLTLAQGQGVYLSCNATGFEAIATTGIPISPAIPVVVYDNAFTIEDDSDPTKTLVFSVGNQATGNDFILNIGSQTADRTLSIPALAGSDTLMTENVAQTVTALKSFWDSAFKIVGSADTSKTLKFEVDAQSVNADLTIDTGAQTVDRTLTIPVLTGNRTLALIDQAQTITGLTSFADTAIQITGSSDPTKLLKFEVDAQTTGKTLTLDTGAQTLDRTLAVPVLAGADTVATLAVANNFSAAQTISNTTNSTSDTTGALILGGGLGIKDAKDIGIGTTTGSKIGQASSKIGFFGAAPVVVPTSATDLRTALINLGLYTTGGATPLDLNGGAFTTTGAVSLGNTTIPTGKTLTVTDLTAGRVTYSSTAGLQTNSANLTFNGTNFAHGGSGTFATGTGAVSLNGTVSIASTALVTATITTATTNNLVQVGSFNLHCSGTPTVGFGPYFTLKADSASVADRTQFEIDCAWVSATDASRTSYSRFYQYDTVARECFRMECDGSAARMGFLGASSIARPTTGIAAATFVANTSLIANDTAIWDGYTVGQVVKALRNFGLLA